MSLCRFTPPCGKCTICSVLKRTEWANRILLETVYSKHTLFITLTYNDKSLPTNGSVSPEHAVNFIKRLKYYHEKSLRYYICGEYGEKGLRPHYHAVIFSPDPIDHSSVESAWTYGFIHFGLDSNNAVAQYVAGYITKKLNRDDEYKDSILGSRHKEFSRKSQGLGRDVVTDIISATAGHLPDGDVYKSIQIDGRKIYLGKYVISKLRKALLNETKEPLFTKEMRALQFEKKYEEAKEKKVTLSEVNKQKRLNLISKVNLFKKEKKL